MDQESDREDWGRLSPVGATVAVAAVEGAARPAGSGAEAPGGVRAPAPQPLPCREGRFCRRPPGDPLLHGPLRVRLQGRINSLDSIVSFVFRSLELGVDLFIQNLLLFCFYFIKDRGSSLDDVSCFLCWSCVLIMS